MPNLAFSGIVSEYAVIHPEQQIFWIKAVIFRRRAWESRIPSA
jgi:hypothetical protein